jgi:hypothetical protein
MQMLSQFVKKITRLVCIQQYNYSDTTLTPSLGVATNPNSRFLQFGQNHSTVSSLALHSRYHLENWLPAGNCFSEHVSRDTRENPP